MAFKSRNEVDKYCQHEQIECLECGRWYSFLPPHLHRTHGMTADEYRERHNLPASAPLAGSTYREAHRAKIKRQVASGGLNYQHLAQATEAAKTAGRGKLRDYDQQDRANRAANIKHDQLPAGAKRADGRDADHAREYQRQYRTETNKNLVKDIVMSLSKRRGPLWTDDEDKKLIEEYEIKTAEELANEMPGRTVASVRGRIMRLRKRLNAATPIPSPGRRIKMTLRERVDELKSEHSAAMERIDRLEQVVSELARMAGISHN